MSKKSISLENGKAGAVSAWVHNSFTSTPGSFSGHGASPVHAFSVETGRRIALRHGRMLRLPAQPAFSSLDIDSAAGCHGVPVSLEDGRSLRAPPENLADHGRSPKHDEGELRRTRFHLSASPRHALCNRMAASAASIGVVRVTGGRPSIARVGGTIGLKAKW